MDVILDGLKGAASEIIGGAVLVFLGWLYTKYRAFMKVYEHRKAEFANMLNQVGAMNRECERLQSELQRKDEALRQAEAQRQADSQRVTELRSQLEGVRAELGRKTEAEAQRQEDSQRVTELQSQLEGVRAELNRKTEALSEAEAQRQKDSQRVTELQGQLEAQRQELERAKQLLKQNPAMSDEEFLELCKSGEARKVEAAIMIGANVNATNNDGWTALMLVTENGHTDTANLLRRYGAQ